MHHTGSQPVNPHEQVTVHCSNDWTGPLNNIIIMIFLLPIYLESIWEKQQFVMQQDFATNLLSSPSALILYDTSMYVRNNISISLQFHTSNVINHWIMVDIFIFSLFIYTCFTHRPVSMIFVYFHMII